MSIELAIGNILIKPIVPRKETILESSPPKGFLTSVKISSNEQCPSTNKSQTDVKKIELQFELLSSTEKTQSTEIVLVHRDRQCSCYNER